MASIAVASQQTGRTKESVIYLKRLAYISPENSWATSYARKIDAGNVNTLSRIERNTIISNIEERKVRSQVRNTRCSEKPILACSPREANDVAIAMCASVMGGCELLQRDLETDEHYLADQACNALVNQMTGQAQTLDSMLLAGAGTMINESASKARNSENLFSQLIFGVALTVMDIGFKATVFDQCTYSARQNCRRIYNEWQYSCR